MSCNFLNNHFEDLRPTIEKISGDETFFWAQRTSCYCEASKMLPLATKLSRQIAIPKVFVWLVQFFLQALFHCCALILPFWKSSRTVVCIFSSSLFFAMMGTPLFVFFTALECSGHYQTLVHSWQHFCQQTGTSGVFIENPPFWEWSRVIP